MVVGTAYLEAPIGGLLDAGDKTGRRAFGQCGIPRDLEGERPEPLGRQILGEPVEDIGLSRSSRVINASDMRCLRWLVHFVDVVGQDQHRVICHGAAVLGGAGRQAVAQLGRDSEIQTKTALAYRGLGFIGSHRSTLVTSYIHWCQERQRWYSLDA